MIALALPTPTGPAVLTIAGATMTAGPGDLVFGGTTITAGGQAVTIAGTRVSLEVGASDVVVGTETVPLPVAVQTGLGGWIMSGFGNIGVGPAVVVATGAPGGNGSGSGNGTGVSEFFGGVGRRRGGWWGVAVAGVVGTGVGVGAFVL